MSLWCSIRMPIVRPSPIADGRRSIHINALFFGCSRGLSTAFAFPRLGRVRIGVGVRGAWRAPKGE